MCIQSIQRKKCLCKLISATFLANSIGLPTTFAAEAVDTSVSNTDIKDENGLPTIKGNNEDRKYPSWYFHADGTPLTEAELKQRNYKESYSSVEIARIYELLNTYGLEKVQKMQFNVSFRQNPDGSTTIDVNDKANNNPTKGVEFGKGKDGSTVKPGTTPTNSDKEKQLNPTTDGSGTAPTDTKTVPTCDANSELVGGVCMLKCAAGSTRNAADKLCHVTSCPSDSIFNADKTACTACPTGEIPDASQTKCVKKTVDCGENEIYADNDKTSCKACPVGTKPNAAQTSCEDVTCGENEIYADENKRTCKVCPTDTVPNADQTECVEKTTPAKPSVTPTVTCDAEKGEYKGADGTCQTCPTGQKLNDNEDGCVAVPATTECKDGQEKWKDACVDKCKDGETRNQETGVCAAAATPNKAPAAPVETPSNGGGGSKSGIGKALAGVAGLAALASLFGHGGSGGSGDDHPNVNADEGKAEVTRIDATDEASTKLVLLEQGTTTLVKSAAVGAPYDAIINLGKMKTNDYVTPTGGDVSILGTKFVNIPFESGKPFHLIGEGGLEHGDYTVFINIHYPKTETDPKGHVQTIKTKITIFESTNTLSSVSDDKVTLISEQVAAESTLALYKTKVVSAHWDKENGFCALTVKGGNVITATESGAADTFSIASKHITEDDCTDEKLKDKEATFSKLEMNSTVNATDGILLDAGETSIDNVGYYNGQDTYDALYERMKETYDDTNGEPEAYVLRGNQLGGGEGASTPIVVDPETGKIVTYNKNDMNEDQNKTCGAGFGVDTCANVRYIDGRLYYVNPEDESDKKPLESYKGDAETFLNDYTKNGPEYDTGMEGLDGNLATKLANRISNGITYARDTIVKAFGGTTTNMDTNVYKTDQSPVQALTTEMFKTATEMSATPSAPATPKQDEDNEEGASPKEQPADQNTQTTDAGNAPGTDKK